MSAMLKPFGCPIPIEMVSIKNGQSNLCPITHEVCDKTCKQNRRVSAAVLRSISWTLY
jgi:hypothetical protein